MRAWRVLICGGGLSSRLESDLARRGNTGFCEPCAAHLATLQRSSSLAAYGIVNLRLLLHRYTNENSITDGIICLSKPQSTIDRTTRILW
jgi:hypothetical protein